MHQLAYMATNIPEILLCEPRIFLLCDFHKFSHEFDKEDLLPDLDEHRVSTGLKKTVCREIPLWKPSTSGLSV